jgi:hypothetical protein
LAFWIWSIYGRNLFETVLHAAEWNQLDAFVLEFAAEIVAEISVVEGGDLFARGECERNSLDVSRGVGLADEIAGMELLEEFGVSGVGLIIARVYFHIEPPARLLADSVPDLRKVDMRMTVLGLRMVLFCGKGL